MRDNFQGLKTILIACALYCLTACSFHPQSTEATTQNADTNEHYNRNTYRFNEKIDVVFFGPVAKFHKKYTPSLVRTGITNFFTNLDDIPNLANDILQLHFYWTMHDMWRLVLNTTIGLLGFFDVASNWFGLTPHMNNFNFTLMHWGAEPSPYLMLPLLGPTTANNMYGLPMNFFLSPVGGFIGTSTAVDAGWEIFGLQAVNSKANVIDTQEMIGQIALDPYIFLRNAYLQMQSIEFAINENPPPLRPKNAATDEGEDEVYTG